LKREYFTSKLLLFGEYGVLKGYNALAIPYPQFTGKLEMSAEGIDENIDGLLKHLYTIQCKLFNILDLKQLEVDIEAGLKFNSNIPFNSGLGSSGALTAALFDKYGELDRTGEVFNLKELNKDLSLIESYFHGNSSGIDPMVSYLNLPLLFKGENNIQSIQTSSFSNHNEVYFFLVNSKVYGQTTRLIDIFNDKFKNIGFITKFREAYKYSNTAIKALLSNELDKLFQSYKFLSGFQYKHMKEHIPIGVQKLFKQGLDSGSFYLKLCGSGGGGYYLGITRNIDWINENLSEYIEDIIETPSFSQNQS
jgi:mevalonate kinase